MLSFICIFIQNDGNKSGIYVCTPYIYTKKYRSALDVLPGFAFGLYDCIFNRFVYEAMMAIAMIKH